MMKLLFLSRKYLVVCFFFITALLKAQTDTIKSASRLSEFSLEDLMSLKVITATGSELTVGEAPATMIVITARQIEERGYEKLEDALQDIPGVDIIHLNGYAPSMIYFRGMYGAENLRTLLLIDGIRENNIAGSPDLAGPAYTLHNVERIEIIWGPASALYGADAFGGVINIITKKGAEMNGLHYEKEFGTFNTSTDRAWVGVKKNHFDVSFSGALSSTDGPRFTNRDPYYSGSFVDKAWSFYGAITHEYKKFKTTLGFRAFDTPMSWGTFLNSATKQLNLPSQGNGNTGAIGILYEDIRNEHPSLYEPFSRTGYIQEEYAASSKLKLFGSFIYRETGVSDRSYVYLSIDTNLSSTIDTAHIYRVPAFNFSKRIRGDLTARYELSGNQNVYGGVQFYEDNVENGNRGEILDTNKYVIDGIPVINLRPQLKPRLFTIRDNFSAFVQYALNTTLLHKTGFTAGLRYDKNSDYESPISPRLAVVSSPDENFTFKLLYGTAFRSPTVTEVNATIAATGSKAVNPERVSTYEINLIYHTTSSFSLQVNGFHNELSDIFVLNSLLGGNFQQKQTLGKANVSGAEVLLDVFPSKHFSAFGNFTYQKGKQTDTSSTEFDIPDLPKMKGTIGITFGVEDMMTVSLISNWIGDRELPHSNPYGVAHGYSLDGYIIGDVVLTTKKYFENRVSASVNVRNVFNTAYLDPGIRTADGILYSSVLEQTGRMVFFKIMVNLY